MIEQSLNRGQVHTYNVTDDLSIQLMEIYKLSKFPKCNCCGMGNFWNITSPSSLIFSKYLAKEFSHDGLKGCHVLIVGCGVGLEGIVLAKLGAIVSFLDHIPDSLQLVNKNCLLNDIESSKMINCCWQNSEKIQNIGKYDLIIGSDILYYKTEWVWIISLLKNSLETNGLAFFADYMVSNWKDFSSGLKKAGFVVNQTYLFGWDEIPGNNGERFIEFLKDELKIEWAKIENISKIDDGKTIIVSNKEKSLSLKLNDEKTKVNLKIDDGRVDEFTVKTENDKLNIYNWTANKWISKRQKTAIISIGRL